MSRVPDPLRHRDFRRLWLAGLVSETGDWLLLVALPIVVYGFTGSALHTSYAFLLELAPAVLLGPVGGRLADRFDRRRLLVAVSLAQALALLPLLAVRDGGDLPILYGVTVAEAALLALFGPAKNALLPALVPAAQLVGANALVGLGTNLGRLVGGPLGGLLLAAAGLPVLVAADLVTFLVAAALVATLAPVRRPPGRLAKGGGWGRVADRPVLAAGALAGVWQGLFLVLFVVFVARELGGGEAETGLLRGVQAAGAIGAGVLLATARRHPRPLGLVAAGACGFGVVTVAIWNGPLVTTGLGYYVTLFVLVGAPGVVLATGLVSAIQEAAGDADRGQAFGIFDAVQQGGAAVGMVLAGLLGDRLGVVPVLNLQALLAFGVAALAGAALWRRRPAGAGATPPAGNPARPSATGAPAVRC